MIVAFEGAPAVGKSTVAAFLGKSGAAVIPEVNMLFRRSRRHSQSWYLDRQVARCEMAAFASKHGKLAILDGDPLQPVWFGWIFPGEGWIEPAAALAHFEAHARDDTLWLPDKYLLFTVSEDQQAQRLFARERERRGEARAREKVARYAAMAEPQSRYFGALAAAFPGWVERIDTQSEPAEVAAAITAMQGRSAPPAQEAIAFLQNWFG